MKTTVASLFVVGLLGCSTSTPKPESTNELGLDIRRLEDGQIEGTFTTQTGSVAFRSMIVQDKIFQITFARDSRQFGAVVDFNTYVADLTADEGFEITSDDRFIVSALATAVEEQIGKDTPVADNLFRLATLFGYMDEGPLPFDQVVGNPAQRRLCSEGACSLGHTTFYESGSGNDTNSGHTHTHGSHSSSTWSIGMDFGRNERHNPCHARCGGGCYSVGTSAWTSDCGNHDACEHYHTGSCGGELLSASDDYIFANNCGC